jgi:hypothetical protein
VVHSHSKHSPTGTLPYFDVVGALDSLFNEVSFKDQTIPIISAFRNIADQGAGYFLQKFQLV